MSDKPLLLAGCLLLDDAGNASTKAKRRHRKELWKLSFFVNEMHKQSGRNDDDDDDDDDGRQSTQIIKQLSCQAAARINDDNNNCDESSDFGSDSKS